MKFYQSIAPYYHHIFPLNPKQVSFVTEAVESSKTIIESSKEPPLLEVGCGVGGLTQGLAKVFPSIETFDLDPEMVRLAQMRCSQFASTHIQQGNMLDLSRLYPQQKFCGVVCFGNSLVHLDNETEIAQFCSEAYKVLLPGAPLLLQIINYDRILDQQVDSLPTIENEHIRFVRNYRYQAHLHKIEFATQLLVKTESKTLTQSQLLYPIRHDSLVSRLRHAGFTQVTTFGGFDRSPFLATSVPLVVEARA